MTKSNFNYSALEKECFAIADWWLKYAVDHEGGGFYGEVDIYNNANRRADKGIILNSRILWFFSEVAVFANSDQYRQAADRAYRYLTENFVDNKYGGVFWSVDCGGKMHDSRKHTYAQAFAIYGSCAYYQLSGEKYALDVAMQCFNLMETHAYDSQHGGYFEASSRDWSPTTDVRLSEREPNYPKTMNTHLHVLESYTLLHGVVNTPVTEHALRRVLEVYCDRIVNRENGHLRMFMSADWQDFSQAFTFGHDIESSWLLHKALKALDDSVLTQRYMPLVLQLGSTTYQEGMSGAGAVLDEYDFVKKEYHSHSAWWVQAEAMVGFLVLWSVTKNDVYWEAAKGIWDFVQKYHIDRENGEWFWHSTADVSASDQPYKMGFWKAPYHNGRAMMEMCRILGR